MIYTSLPGAGRGNGAGRGYGASGASRGRGPALRERRGAGVLSVRSATGRGGGPERQERHGAGRGPRASICMCRHRFVRTGFRANAVWENLQNRPLVFCCFFAKSFVCANLWGGMEVAEVRSVNLLPVLYTCLGGPTTRVSEIFEL